MKQFRVKTIVKLIFGGMVITNSFTDAFAYELGTVSSGSGSASSSSVTPASAPYQAPTQGSLTATEPQSVIGQQYIENNITGASNYTDIVNIAPSVMNVSPNGPGGNDSGAMTLRGFQDGQYNVTFDGIPFADGDDFTHHVTSYFMSQDTGNVVVDRGPGNASTIGDATFGGTIAIHSKNPGSNPAITPYLSTGSFNTHLAGVQFDTGVMQNYNDFSAFIDYKNFSTDGYLANNKMRRDNLFAKFIKPISENTAITFVSMQNSSTQNASQGATSTQLAQFGPNMGLSLDPTSQAYAGYNQDRFTSDMEYVGLQTQQGDWKIDDKLYTYAFRHDALQGTDPSGTSPNGTALGATNIPGVAGLTQYRSYGNVLNVTKAIGASDLKFGMWIDQQKHEAWSNNVDLTLGSAFLSQQQAYNSNSTTLQPYVQYAWRPVNDLTITPGVKYNSFSRSYNASYDANALGPVSLSETWSAILPSLDVHYFLDEKWAVYGQVAEGFVPPTLGNFTVTNPALGTGSLKPQNTVNYQAGSTWKSQRLTLSGDVYYIDNNNLTQNGAIVNGIQTFVNSGVARIKGFESEATYYVGEGFSVYGNFTMNKASVQVQNAPTNTAAAGLIFNKGAPNEKDTIYASLMAKEIGPRYSGTTDANGNSIYFSSYAVTNLAVGYNFTKQTKLNLNVNNLFNRTDTVLWSGLADVNGNPMFYTNAGRGFMLSLTTAL
jgi:iron complex outermembrane receptor protein